MKTEIFKKNLLALQGEQYENLRKKLQKIKELKDFTYIIDKDPLNCNVVFQSVKKIYENPLQELQKSLKLFQNDYARYPILFFYGLGNGILYKSLLANKEHKKIIVYERDVELIFLALNMIDFHDELISGRFIIIHNEEMNYAKADFLCSYLNLFLKTYNLHIHSKFYEEQKKDINHINTLNIQAIRSIALRRGNDPIDALQGIEQFVLNLPKMINHPSFSELKKKRSNKSKTAILVATGPSLKKQLPLLKKYANKATIFCVDSAYAVLAKEGIKPDYVCMLERTDTVTKCFDNDFKEFDKDITFVLVSLVYKDAIKFLEKNKRKYILVSRAYPFAYSLGLHEFGYMQCGMSVAHMNAELAILLGHENIIMIGQDLAYSDDGKSHSEGFVYGDKFNTFEEDKDKYQTQAYGGKGLVQSSKIWVLFKQVFENLISKEKNAKFYNATEGGARIEGAIEKPFKELCEKLLVKDIKKPFAKLHTLKKEQREKLMLQAYKRIKDHIKNSQKFLKECKRLHRALNQKSKIRYTLNELNTQIDDLKRQIESNKFIFMQEAITPSLFHLESTFSKIYVHAMHNESDKQNKLVAWIEAHKTWIEDISELVNIQEKALKIAIMPLQDILEKRKLI
ncbi:TPA: motility associated factor glycosyltransferase family protein [Campylobacter lari]|nr:motility associated factor glycosyltransferase family protein [Campylobacter lari]